MSTLDLRDRLTQRNTNYLYRSQLNLLYLYITVCQFSIFQSPALVLPVAIYTLPVAVST